MKLICYFISGDRQYKPLITSEPEILTIPLDGSEDFLIIACDGFWDCVDEKQAASILYEIIQWSPREFFSLIEIIVKIVEFQKIIFRIVKIVRNINLNV